MLCMASKAMIKTDYLCRAILPSSPTVNKNHFKGAHLGWAGLHHWPISHNLIRISVAMISIAHCRTAYTDPGLM